MNMVEIECICCFDYVKEPTKCPHCAQTFCLACICSWVEKKGECIHCRSALKISDLTQTPPVVDEDGPDFSYCEIHSKCFIMFCGTCDSCVCQDCMDHETLHDNHSFIRIKKAIEKETSKLICHMDSLNSFSSETQLDIESIGFEIEFTEREKIITTQELKKERNEINTKFLINKITFETRFAALEKRKENKNSSLINVKETQSKIQDLLKASKYKLLSQKKVILQEIQRYDEPIRDRNNQEISIKLPYRNNGFTIKEPGYEFVRNIWVLDAHYELSFKNKSGFKLICELKNMTSGNPFENCSIFDFEMFSIQQQLSNLKFNFMSQNPIEWTIQNLQKKGLFFWNGGIHMVCRTKEREEVLKKLEEESVFGWMESKFINVYNNYSYPEIISRSIVLGLLAILFIYIFRYLFSTTPVPEKRNVYYYVKRVTKGTYSQISDFIGSVSQFWEQ